MALSATHHFILRDFSRKGLLPRHGALLEIGEANWYGNVDPHILATDIQEFVCDPPRRDALMQRLDQLLADKPPTYLFDLVKIFYEIYFEPSEMQAVDFEGTAHAHPFDLNLPLALSRRFEVVINHGTAEHIFNIGQVFKTIHDFTIPGGVMIHESPFTGWIDHGFYSLQPTLFFDLAASNHYSLAVFIEDLAAKTVTQLQSRDQLYELARSKQLPDNAMLLTIFKKDPDDRPFEIPIQGYYRQALSERGIAAWTELRY